LDRLDGKRSATSGEHCETRSAQSSSHGSNTARSSGSPSSHAASSVLGLTDACDGGAARYHRDFFAIPGRSLTTSGVNPARPNNRIVPRTVSPEPRTRTGGLEALREFDGFTGGGARFRILVNGDGKKKGESNPAHTRRTERLTGGPGDGRPRPR